MSKHKAGGSKASQHKRPTGKRLGVKVAHGQNVKVGSILVRQRGTRILGGEGVKVGRDHTIYSIIAGRVAFKTKFDKKQLSVAQ